MGERNQGFCILFALGREAQPLRRALRPLERLGKVPVYGHRCGPGLATLIVETGVGHVRMSKALEWLTAQPQVWPPAAVLSAGFAGALRPDLEPGDVVL